MSQQGGQSGGYKPTVPMASYSSVVSGQHGGQQQTTLPMHNSYARPSGGIPMGYNQQPMRTAGQVRPHHEFRPTSTSTPPRPAYTAVGTPSQATRPVAQMSPSQWPAAVRQYVERCFKSCRPSQRVNLQSILRTIIQDAQSRGELYSRAWDKIPIPDLSLKPDDAAAIVIRFSTLHSPSPRPSTRFDVRPSQPRGLAWSTQQQLGVRAPRPMQSSSNIAKPSMVRFNIEKTGRKRRFSEFQDSDSNSDVSQGGAYADDEEVRRQQRAGRFENDDNMYRKNMKSSKRAAHSKSKIATMLKSVAGESEQINWDLFALKGTCKKLEKSYFRLTSAPDPSTVRPEPVLRKALGRLVGLIASGDVNYFYAQDQFKGMRQDCVVQAIKGGLAVEIYEAHARAALEYGDIAEYNQCQGQLRSLYSEGIRSPRDCQSEFIAYRILYQTVHASKGELVGLLNTLQEVGSTPNMSNHPNIKHALRVRRALVSQNYALFFKLYESAPALGRALMDLVVPKLRFLALTQFISAFKPSLSLSFISSVLGFERPDVNDTLLQKYSGKTEKKASGSSTVLPGCSRAEFEGKHRGEDSIDDALVECIAWLRECKAVLLDENLGSSGVVDCKASANKIELPEEKDAVAHGDANLDIGDFLKGFSM